MDRPQRQRRKPVRFEDFDLSSISESIHFLNEEIDRVSAEIEHYETILQNRTPVHSTPVTGEPCDVPSDNRARQTESCAIRNCNQGDSGSVQHEPSVQRQSVSSVAQCELFQPSVQQPSDVSAAQNESHVVERDQRNSNVPVVEQNISSSSNTSTSTCGSTSAVSSKYERLMVLSLFVSPHRFTGEPSDWPDFAARINNFFGDDVLSDSEKLEFLVDKFLDGDALKCAKSLHGRSFTSTMKRLEERYGHPTSVANSFIAQLLNGGPLGPHDRNGLQEFADLLTSTVETLENSGAVYLTEAGCGPNISKLVNRLPLYMRTDWENRVMDIVEHGNKSAPGLQDLARFVDRHARSKNNPFYTVPVPAPVERTTTQRPAVVGTGKVTSGKRTVLSAVTNVEQSVNSSSTQRDGRNRQVKRCTFCSKQGHAIWQCPEFTKLSQRDRFYCAKRQGLCFVCLQESCDSARCPRIGIACVNCDKPHNKLLACYTRNRVSRNRAEQPGRLHNQENTDSSEQVTRKPSANRSSSSEHVGSHSCHFSSDDSFLMTVLPVKVHGGGKAISTYAFVDSGSRASFVDETLAQLLGLTGSAEQTVQVSTVNDCKPTQMIPISFIVSNMDTGYEVVISDSAYVMRGVDLSGQLSKSVPTVDLKNYEHLKDFKIHSVDYPFVSVLLGLPVRAAHQAERYYTGGPSEPYAVETQLGTAIAGPVMDVPSCPVMVDVKRCDINANNDSNNTYNGSECLEKLVERLLKLENYGSEYPPDMGMSFVDQQAVKNFKDSVRQRSDGHYECRLTWKSSDIELPYNRDVAKSRLLSLQRKFAREGAEYERMYRAAMEEYVNEGWASPVPDEEVNRRGPRTFYLPHFGVVNSNKPGKIRVVFDAAATCDGVSLNSVLLSGPDSTNSLVGVLLRSRLGKFCVAGDIKSMFNQCFVSEEDRDSLRFLWLDDSGEVVDYRMNVHVFGASDSPFCANRMLRQTALDHGQLFEERVVNAVKSNFYVDDTLLSEGTVNDTVDLVCGVKSLLAKGGFELTKFASNDEKILQALDERDVGTPQSPAEVVLDHSPVTRALGLKWDLENDGFGFNIGSLDKPDTMRGMLSITAQVFDPLGYASPVLLKARLILRACWERKLGWDEDLPLDIQSQWTDWKSQLPCLQNLRIPRPFFTRLDTCKASNVQLQLHIFADSSQCAIGVACYLRAEVGEDIHVSTIVFGKSKLLPRKPKLTIPRSELKAAVDAVRTGERLKCELGLELSKRNVIYWTDSRIVLSYIHNESRSFHVFVANRQSEIRQFTDVNQWRFCPGELNTSDDASRGVFPREFTSSTHRYITGPSFLKLPISEWPNFRVDTLQQDDPEVRVMKIDVDEGTELKVMNTDSKIKMNRIVEFVENSSSWRKVRKVVVRIQRLFAHVSHSETVTQQEMDRAERAIVRAVQRHYFGDDIAKLERGDVDVSRHSSISGLSPYLGPDGILRAGGRLRHAKNVSTQLELPAILPSAKDCQLSRLLILDCHRMLGSHTSEEFTLGKLREKYWVIHARSYVRRAIHKCAWCRKRNARPIEQTMGEIPSDRLALDEPCFTYTGTDLFGPVMCKDRRSVLKYYGVIFLCMTTTAIHIELVKSLGTDDFILALMRFVAIRGGVRHIRSDNGTNYVGAEKELRELVSAWDQDRVSAEMEVRGVEWTFQTPYASSQSGIWERRVKEVKRHMYAIVGNSEPSPDVMRTALHEISAIMNQVPLCPVSSDPNSLEAITPGHFLYNKPASVLTPVPTDTRCIYKKKWRQVQQISDSYWKRFRREFVPTLLPKKKWKSLRRNLRVGDLVVLFNPDLPRSRWDLGRVIDVFHGVDGGVRSVRVKTKDGIYKRPIQRLGLVAECEVC